MSLIELLSEVSEKGPQEEYSSLGSLPFFGEMSKCFCVDRRWHARSRSSQMEPQVASICAHFDLGACSCTILFSPEAAAGELVLMAEELFRGLSLLQEGLQQQGTGLKVHSLACGAATDLCKENGERYWFQTECRTLWLGLRQNDTPQLKQHLSRLFRSGYPDSGGLICPSTRLYFQCLLSVHASSSLERREIELKIQQQLLLQVREQQLVFITCDGNVCTPGEGSTVSAVLSERGEVKMELALHIRLGELRLSIKELLELQKGARLQVRWEPEQLVTLMFDNEALAHGHLRRSGPELLFIAESPIRPERDEAEKDLILVETSR